MGNLIKGQQLLLRILAIFYMAFSFMVLPAYAVESKQNLDNWEEESYADYDLTEGASNRPSSLQPEVDVSVELRKFKDKLVAYLQTTEKGKTILQVWDYITAHWIEFKQDPRGFLTALGITNEDMLVAADNYIGVNENRLMWYEKLGIKSRILSCMAHQTNGNIISGVEVVIPSEYYMKRIHGSSPGIDLNTSQNLSSIEFGGMFPKRFADNIIGYNGEFIIPFILKALDLKKPVDLQVKLTGELCKIVNDECQLLELNLKRKFSASSRINSPECGVIVDSMRRHKSDDYIKITDVSWDKDTLKIEAKTDEHFNNPDVFIEGPKNLEHKKPHITYLNGMLKAAIKVMNAKDLYGKKLYITFGYPYYFTTTTLVPTIKNKDAFFPSVTLLNSFTDGVMLVFCSPILALMLAILLLHKKKQQETLIRQAAMISLPMLLIYPLFMLLIESWGNQFLYPALTFSSALAMIIFGFYLLYAPNLHLAGLLCALLILFSPVHFIADTMNDGGCLNFLFMALGAFGASCIFLRITQRIKKTCLFVKISESFAKKRVDSHIVLAVMMIFASWMAVIAFIEMATLWKIPVCAFIGLCVFISLQTKKYPALAVFIVVAVSVSSFTKINQENTLTEQAVTAAIEKGKIVYAVVDTPWCLSCQIGKASFMVPKMITRMIEDGDILVLKASSTNPVIKETADHFEIKPEPLHIIYTKDKPNGEVLPWFIDDHSVLKMIQKTKFDHVK